MQLRCKGTALFLYFDVPEYNKNGIFPLYIEKKHSWKVLEH